MGCAEKVVGQGVIGMPDEVVEKSGAVDALVPLPAEPRDGPGEDLAIGDEPVYFRCFSPELGVSLAHGDDVDVGKVDRAGLLWSHGPAALGDPGGEVCRVSDEAGGRDDLDGAH